MPATLGRRLGRDEAITGINVTPLVDVCLVLLVVLMVASTYIVSRSLTVDVPKAASSDGPVAAPATVAIRRDGALLWNEKPIAESELAHQLRLVVERDREAVLVVSGDRAAMHGRVVHVLDLGKRAGLTHFALHVVAE